MEGHSGHRSPSPYGGPRNFNPPGCAATALLHTLWPGEGFQVADIRVCDVDGKAGWKELEKAYGINLDPARIKGQPAIIEIEKGRADSSFHMLISKPLATIGGIGFSPTY